VPSPPGPNFRRTCAGALQPDQPNASEMDLAVLADRHVLEARLAQVFPDLAIGAVADVDGDLADLVHAGACLAQQRREIGQSEIGLRRGILGPASGSS